MSEQKDNRFRGGKTVGSEENHIAGYLIQGAVSIRGTANLNSNISREFMDQTDTSLRIGLVNVHGFGHFD
jgi:hypothetical protein